MNWLNPTWLLSRLLERFGVKTYQERVSFSAHFFAGSTFALIGVWLWWVPVLWIAYTLSDEFVIDGWKGADTTIDLISKLAAPFGWLAWKVSLLIMCCR